MSENNTVLEKFHTQITGDSPKKLVFLHGVMGFAQNFRRIAKDFEDEFQVLTYDQRGHGRSFHPPSGFAPKDYAQDLHDIIDALGWSEITLVGHSMGGRAAYTFASLWSERVTRLVIEDIGPSMQKTRASLVDRMLDAVPVPFASKREAKEWFAADFLRIFAEEPNARGLAAYLYSNITENDAKEAVWRFSETGIRQSVAEGRKADRWEEIESLKMPTLLVRGGESTDLPHDLYEEMLRRNPRIEGVEIPQAGHWVHSDQPEEFIKVLKRFFSGSAS